MTTFNLTCEAVEATLPDYIDETLEAWVRESIDEHLTGCARCTALASDLRDLEREAAALPALVPERDIWLEVAHGIGVPVVRAKSAPAMTPEPALTVTPELGPEPDPFVATSEPVELADAPPPVVEPLAPAPSLISEPVVSAPLQAREPVASAPLEVSEAAMSAPLRVSEPVVSPSLQVSERVVSVPLEIEPIASFPIPIYEPLIPESEPAVPLSETLLPPAESLTPTSVPITPLAARRKKNWGPAWMSLAAAALVLVTAGTTFLLTARRFGGAHMPDVVTGTVTRQASSRVKPQAGRGNRALSLGLPQVASDSLVAAPQRSSLVVASTSAPVAARSPDEIVYDREINMLQKMTRRRASDLDASTAAVIEKNLRIIDANIAQIRAALQKEPESPLLDDQVSRALDMKVDLLRRVALLRSNT